MDACIIECTTLHKLIQAFFLEAGTAELVLKTHAVLLVWNPFRIRVLLPYVFVILNGQTNFVAESAKCTAITKICLSCLIFIPFLLHQTTNAASNKVIRLMGFKDANILKSPSRRTRGFVTHFCVFLSMISL